MYMFQNRVSPASMSGICLDVCYFGRRRNGWAWWALFELSALQGSLPQYTIVYQRVWHLRFEYVTGLIILVNLVMVGVELEMGLSTPGFYELLGRWARQWGLCSLMFPLFLGGANLGKVQNYINYGAFMSHESLHIWCAIAILMREAKQNCIQTSPRTTVDQTQERRWSTVPPEMNVWLVVSNIFYFP